MTPGITVQIKRKWRQNYRAPGTPFAGILQSTSPGGTVARVRMDDVADSYVLVSHIEPAGTPEDL